MVSDRLMLHKERYNLVSENFVKYCNNKDVLKNYITDICINYTNVIQDNYFIPYDLLQTTIMLYIESIETFLKRKKEKNYIFRDYNLLKDCEYYKYSILIKSIDFRGQYENKDYLQLNERLLKKASLLTDLQLDVLQKSLFIEEIVRINIIINKCKCYMTGDYKELLLKKEKAVLQQKKQVDEMKAILGLYINRRNIYLRILEAKNSYTDLEKLDIKIKIKELEAEIEAKNCFITEYSERL